VLLKLVGGIQDGKACAFHNLSQLCFAFGPFSFCDGSERSTTGGS